MNLFLESSKLVFALTDISTEAADAARGEGPAHPQEGHQPGGSGPHEPQLYQVHAVFNNSTGFFHSNVYCCSWRLAEQSKISYLKYFH